MLVRYKTLNIPLIKEFMVEKALNIDIPVKCRLILVRHGETFENRQGIFQGQTEGTLSAKGIEQNRLLALQLSYFDIDTIFTSPLKRAVETAKTVHQYHKQSAIVESELLKEWRLGVLERKPFRDDFSPLRQVEGMERIDEVVQRISAFLEKHIIPMPEQSTIAIVSHGLILKMMIALLQRIDMNEIDKIPLMENSSFLLLK